MYLSQVAFPQPPRRFARKNGEALAENHLYLMTDKRGVSASSEAVLLVRGSYSVG